MCCVGGIYRTLLWQLNVDKSFQADESASRCLDPTSFFGTDRTHLTHCPSSSLRPFFRFVCVKRLTGVAKVLRGTPTVRPPHSSHQSRLLSVTSPSCATPSSCVSLASENLTSDQFPQTQEARRDLSVIKLIALVIEPDAL